MMCDVPEEEWAEYLLWRERAISRVETKAIALRIRESWTIKTGQESEPLPTPA
jgi:hypothetical protein